MKCTSVNENTFEFQDVSTEFVNVLRRYCMNCIPILAPDYVEFLKNETAFFDEYLAHRIAMIPFKNTEDPNGVVYLNIKNDTDEDIVVYSGDLKGDYEVVYDNIPLLILTPGDEISFEVHFAIGKGSEHAKFKPCYAWFYTKDDKTYLEIDPYGHMSSREIFEKCLDILDKELKEIYDFVFS